jgi:hypothetical protein
MPSLTNKKIRYFLDRCINAYQMLRTGRFRLMWKSLWLEVDKRVANIRAKIFLITRGDSLFARLDRRKVLPASYRPTTSTTASSAKLQVDVVVLATELKRIRSTFIFSEQSDLK